MTLKKTLERVIGSVACAAMVSCGSYERSQEGEGDGPVRSSRSFKADTTTSPLSEDDLSIREPEPESIEISRQMIERSQGQLGVEIFDRVMRRYSGKQGAEAIADILVKAAPEDFCASEEKMAIQLSEFRQVAGALDTPTVQHLIDSYQQKKVLRDIIDLLDSAAYNKSKSVITATAHGLEQYIGTPAMKPITKYFVNLRGNKCTFPVDEWGAKFVTVVAYPQVQQIIKKHHDDENQFQAILGILQDVFDAKDKRIIPETIRCLQHYAGSVELANIRRKYWDASSDRELLAQARDCNRQFLFDSIKKRQEHTDKGPGLLEQKPVNYADISSP